MDSFFEIITDKIAESKKLGLSAFSFSWDSGKDKYSVMAELDGGKIKNMHITRFYNIDFDKKAGE